MFTAQCFRSGGLRCSPLNAALGLTTTNLQGWRNGKVLSGSYVVRYIATLWSVGSLASCQWLRY
ncbi:hypothetical protein DXE02_25110 [Vibrio parahaemolyticus]|nr:hypothetical protein [Vibrio parahaemolyticus]OMC57934.1 hypothetical protein CFSAN001595_0224090 [Vibrio parahaemolyticus CFSAN001595]EGR2568586.1 hypothetical protein [Vibrio parahaemolyticus]EGR3330641.1 hypothetical protein [Vibrio parahaemolyticus]TOZ60935.1 hypothetical protein DXJ94_13955 [Vibrio parahaemolyticus]